MYSTILILNFTIGIINFGFEVQNKFRMLPFLLYQYKPQGKLGLDSSVGRAPAR